MTTPPPSAQQRDEVPSRDAATDIAAMEAAQAILESMRGHPDRWNISERDTRNELTYHIQTAYAHQRAAEAQAAEEMAQILEGAVNGFGWNGSREDAVRVVTAYRALHPKAASR